MKNQLTKCIGSLLVFGLFAVPSLLQAQPTAHYGTGAEGIKAATLPPPGWYIRDYNIAYYSDRLTDAHGHNSGADARVFSYVNLPRVIWITDQKVLGGYIGLDALIPLQYADLKVPPTGLDHGTFGIGDLFAETTWSTHTKQFDFSLGAGVWAPTGDSSGKPAGWPTTRAGLGYWGTMFTAGATWYPDEAKKWSVSALNRYEVNFHKEDAGMTPGNAYTVEGGVGYAFTKTIEGGAIGYYQQQVTGDDGPAALQRPHGRVAGVGPEIGMVVPSAKLNVTLRYAYEFMAENRFQGHTWTLTLTKWF